MIFRVSVQPNGSRVLKRSYLCYGICLPIVVAVLLSQHRLFIFSKFHHFHLTYPLNNIFYRCQND